MTDEEVNPEAETVVISEKEHLLKQALVKVETDYIQSEINLKVCTKLIKLYKEEIKKEQDAC